VRWGRTDLFTAKLPGSQTRAIWVLALFAAIQVADGTLTAVGVARFGLSAEGNPVLALCFGVLSVGTTIALAKLFAISCATLLHLRSQHLPLALLTVLYVLGAIVPWTWVLVR
jgi:hypothetical protein